VLHSYSDSILGPYIGLEQKKLRGFVTYDFTCSLTTSSLLSISFTYPLLSWSFDLAAAIKETTFTHLHVGSFDLYF